MTREIGKLYLNITIIIFNICQFKADLFVPSDVHILQMLHNYVGTNASRMTLRGFEPCTPCQPITTPEPKAEISPSPTALTLTCDVPEPYQHISWWLHRCTNRDNEESIVQLTYGEKLFESGFKVKIGIDEKGYFSSLIIADISAWNASGLYQCVAYRDFQSGNQYFSKTDYFIIGRQTNRDFCNWTKNGSPTKLGLQRKLESNDFELDGQKNNESDAGNPMKLELRRNGVQQVTTLVFDFADAIVDPSPEYLYQGDELQAPKAQTFEQIPIQNSSYIRFDFTNGDKIQNRNLNESYEHTQDQVAVVKPNK